MIGDTNHKINRDTASLLNSVDFQKYKFPLAHSPNSAFTC